MLSYSRCVVPVLCNLKSVKFGAAWHARQLPILPVDNSGPVGEVADGSARNIFHDYILDAGTRDSIVGCGKPIPSSGYHVFGSGLR